MSLLFENRNDLLCLLLSQSASIEARLHKVIREFHFRVIAYAIVKDSEMGDDLTLRLQKIKVFLDAFSSSPIIAIGHFGEDL